LRSLIDFDAFSLYGSVSPGCPQPRVVEINIATIDLNTRSRPARLQGHGPICSGRADRIQGILPGTDLALAPTATGVKESIVLHSAAAANSWVFPLKLTGLTAKLASDGSVDLVDASGTTVERIPRGYAFDSKVDPVSGESATTYAVGYALTMVDGAPALRVTLDAGWLADPARVFPVTVDPTFTEVSSSTYAELSAPTGDHSMEKTIKIGSYNSGPDSANSFLLLPKDIDNSGVQVSSVSLALFDTWASTCTAERLDVAPVTQSWTPPGVTAWPGPSFGGSIGNVTPSVPNACANRSGDRTVGDWVTVPLSTGPRRTTDWRCTRRRRIPCIGSSSTRR
jgi:hypothetical protein